MNIIEATDQRLHKVGDFWYIEHTDGSVQRINEATMKETDILIDKMFSDPDRRARVKSLGMRFRT